MKLVVYYVHKLRDFQISNDFVADFFIGADNVEVCMEIVASVVSIAVISSVSSGKKVERDDRVRIGYSGEAVHAAELHEAVS